jgi:hypothetical protein
MSLNQFFAVLFPHSWAIKLSFRARFAPISRNDFVKLPVIVPPSFPRMAWSLSVKVLLVIVLVTIIVKSISALSILRNALNQTPARTAFNLIFANCVLLSKLGNDFSVAGMGIIFIEPSFDCFYYLRPWVLDCIAILKRGL